MSRRRWRPRTRRRGRSSASTLGWDDALTFRILADLVVGVHLLFVVFVVGGGLLLLRWPALVWVHLPAAIWGVLIELFGWVCPLTPLENALRRRAGTVGYEGGFVEHYLLPVLYPGALTRGVQIALGVLVVGVNLAVYTWVLRARRKRLGDRA